MEPLLLLFTLALGLVFVPLKAEGWSISAISFHLNIYTGPGYLGGLLGVINIFLLLFLFWERKLPTATTKDKAMKKVLKCKCIYYIPSTLTLSFLMSSSLS